MIALLKEKIKLSITTTKMDGFEPSTVCRQFKLPAQDGKMRETRKLKDRFVWTFTYIQHKIYTKQLLFKDMTMKKAFIKLSLALFIAGLMGINIAAAATFADVTPNDWFYTYVEQLAAVGVLDATAHNFRPADLINRAEVAKLVVDGMGFVLETPTKAPFKDVPLGKWYTVYIYTAQKNHILAGYQDSNGTPTGYFGPSDPITREQATKITFLSKDIPTNTNGGPHFTDVPTSRWSYIYIESAYNWSVIDGYSDNTFKPKNNINRAEFSKILIGIMNGPVMPANTQQASQQTTQQSTQQPTSY